MNNDSTSKIYAAQTSWHNTIGEYLLKYTGIFLALTILAIGLQYGSSSLRFTPEAGLGHFIKHDVDRTEKTLLFVSVNSDKSYVNEAKILKEAIASYHGVKIISLQENYAGQDLQKENLIVFVLGNQKINDVTGLNNLMKRVAERKLPLFWLGSGFSQVAQIFDIPLSGEEGLSLMPPSSSMTYKDTEIGASGLPFSRANLADFASLGEVLASVKLHDAFTRPALIRHGELIYSAFNPLPSASISPPYALSVIMDSLSLLVGVHKPNPRVIFRLEDINGSDYNKDNTSFKKTTDYLIEQGVYVHLGIIPTMVDDNDVVHSQIDSALPVLKFVKENPDHVGIIQHGYKHNRKDPRNAGLISGEAFEFFPDDDETMGARAAKKFATKVITEGRAVMQQSGLPPTMFEAPHYVISPAQQQAADELFSLMQHKPFYGEVPYGFLKPWLTQRDNIVYVPDSFGYVETFNPDSVNEILYSMEKVASIMPDPIVVVFFHPFIRELPGREDDLEKLIKGMKALNYRFVNMEDEVVPLADLPHP